MILGVDFGFYSVKVVIFDNNKISAIGEKNITEDLNRFDPDKIESTHWVSAFLNLCKELDINLKKINSVVSSIGGKKISIKSITTLEVEEEELNNILTFEAKKLVPLDGSDPVIDYHILGQNSKEIDKIDVILVATTQKIIKAHDQIIKGCSLKNVVFDAVPISLLNCYKFNYTCPKDNVDVIINIGCLSTTIVVHGDNQELFTRELPIGGHQINLEIMESQKIDYKTAEKNKIAFGLSALDQDDEANDPSSIQIMQRNIFSELSDEIRKTLRYYMKSKSGISYNKFYISGGSSNIVGLKDFLNNTLNVEFNVLDPFQKIESITKVENISSYSILIGSVVSHDGNDNKSVSKNKNNFSDISFSKGINKVKSWFNK